MIEYFHFQVFLAKLLGIFSLKLHVHCLFPQPKVILLVEKKQVAGTINAASGHPGVSSPSKQSKRGPGRPRRSSAVYGDGLVLLFFFCVFTLMN